jgi:hypothetical protein
MYKYGRFEILQQQLGVHFHIHLFLSILTSAFISSKDI